MFPGTNIPLHFSFTNSLSEEEGSNSIQQRIRSNIVLGNPMLQFMPNMTSNPELMLNYFLTIALKSSQDSNDIKDLFKTVGNIQLVRTQTINIGTLFILYFEHEDEALKACKVFHEFTSQQQTTPLIVKPMYKNASTQYFAVTGLENIETVNQLCTMYGSVSTIKPWKGNGLPVFYVFMENIEESQAACALL